MVPFVQTYPDSAEYKVHDMVSNFLEIVEHRFQKYLTQWKRHHLPFGLAGDALTAAYVASWFLGLQPLAWIPDTYQSDTHNTIVNDRLCGEFLVRDEIPSNHIGKHFGQYSEQLRAMAAGTVQLWDLDRLDIELFRMYVKETWLSIATRSQLAERWMKDSNECTFTSKEGKNSKYLRHH